MPCVDLCLRSIIKKKNEDEDDGMSGVRGGTDRDP